MEATRHRAKQAVVAFLGLAAGLLTAVVLVSNLGASGAEPAEPAATTAEFEQPRMGCALNDGVSQVTSTYEVPKGVTRSISEAIDAYVRIDYSVKGQDFRVFVAPSGTGQHVWAVLGEPESTMAWGILHELAPDYWAVTTFFACDEWERSVAREASPT